MKKLTLLIIFLISTITTFASDKGKIIATSKQSDRHYYVTFTYTGIDGKLKLGVVGISSAKSYPKTADVILKAADAVGVSCKNIKNTYPVAISKAEFDILFTEK